MDVVFESYKMTLPLEYKLKFREYPLYLLLIFLVTPQSDIRKIDICRSLPKNMCKKYNSLISRCYVLYFVNKYQNTINMDHGGLTSTCYDV